MGTKLNPGNFDCYEAAAPDEPMFVLLARDPSAPSLVQTWAQIRLAEMANGQRSTEELPKVREAIACAAAMALWYQEHKTDGR